MRYFPSLLALVLLAGCQRDGLTPDQRSAALTEWRSVVDAREMAKWRASKPEAAPADGVDYQAALANADRMAASLRAKGGTGIEEEIARVEQEVAADYEKRKAELAKAAREWEDRKAEIERVNREVANKQKIMKAERDSELLKAREAVRAAEGSESSRGDEQE